MQYISERDAEKRYDEFLDEINPVIKINGMEYLPSRVLQEIDETAYNCGMADWLDSENLTTDEDEANDNE